MILQWWRVPLKIYLQVWFSRQLIAPTIFLFQTPRTAGGLLIENEMTRYCFITSHRLSKEGYRVVFISADYFFFHWSEWALNIWVQPAIYCDYNKRGARGLLYQPSNFSHNSLIFNFYLLVRPFFLMHFDWIFVGKVEYTPKGLPSYKSFLMLKNTKSGRFECIHNKGWSNKARWNKYSTYEKLPYFQKYN